MGILVGMKDRGRCQEYPTISSLLVCFIHTVMYFYSFRCINNPLTSYDISMCIRSMCIRIIMKAFYRSYVQIHPFVVALHNVSLALPHAPN